LLTTTNSGTTTPVSADESYTDDGDNATAGTSFSSPLVAGAAALMLVVQPSLSTDEVRQLLQKSSRTFPSSGDPGAVGTCPATASGGSTEQSCYCTTSTCGAGMLDASAAVALAQTTEPASQSMAGALGWGWLLGLAAAVVAVSRSRREG
jgi:serine protease